MTVAIKYCGGCNPRYERGEIVSRLRADYPGIEIVCAGEEADLVAVLCGCPAACASHAALWGRRGKAVLTRPADYDKLRALIEGRENEE